MTTRRCPICDKSFSTEDSDSLPFCGKRCQQIDLGRWLDEEYGLPYEPAESPDEPLDDEPL